MASQRIVNAINGSPSLPPSDAQDVEFGGHPHTNREHRARATRSRPFGRGIVLGLLFFGVLFGVGFLGGRAMAYPVRTGGCTFAQSSLGYGFDGSGWTTTNKQWFRDGAVTWNALLGPTGSFLVNVWEGGSIEIQLAELGAGSGGKAYCVSGGPSHIVIDDNGMTADQFRGVSAHEVGHELGLGHAGRGDSFDGAVPTMTTGCSFIGTETYALAKSLQQDDWAQLVSRLTDDAHANSSFEHGPGFWTVGSGASVQTFSSGGADGPRYMRVTNNGGVIFNEVRVVNPADLTVRLRYKKSSAAAAGTFKVEVWAKQLDYDTTGTCLTEYPWGWDFTSPVVPATYSLIQQVTYTPTTSWSATTSLSEWTAVDGWEGSHVKVVIRNLMTAGSVDIDHFRADHS